MIDLGESVPTQDFDEPSEGTVRTEQGEPRTTAQQFTDWAKAELERRRARDVDLDEDLFDEAVELVVRRMAAKEHAR